MDEMVKFTAHLIQTQHVTLATAKRYVAFIVKNLEHLNSSYLISYFYELLSKGYHAGSINSGMVNAVRAWGHFTNNPDLLLVKKLPVNKHEVSRSILSVNEINQLIDMPCKYTSLKQWRKYNFIFQILSRTALRPIELLRLKVGMLNFGLGSIDLPSTITKNHQPRSIAIPRELRRKLQDQIRTLKADDYLFPSDSGGMLDRNNLTAHFTKRIKRLGIKRNVSLYSLRHSAACRTLQNSDILTTKALLGHSSIETTEQYIHLDISHIAKAMDRDELVKGNMPISEVFKTIILFVKNLIAGDKRFKVEINETEEELIIKVKKNTK